MNLINPIHYCKFSSHTLDLMSACVCRWFGAITRKQWLRKRIMIFTTSIIRLDLCSVCYSWSTACERYYFWTCVTSCPTRESHLSTTFRRELWKPKLQSTIFHKCQCRRREKVILSSLRSTLENRCHRYFKPCFVNIFPEIITGIKHYIFWSCLGPCLKTTINNMSRCFSFYVVSLWSAWLTAQSLVCVFQLIKAFPNDSGAHKQDRLIPYLPQGCIKCAKNNVLFKFYSI